jgi:hypothetical protein
MIRNLKKLLLLIFLLASYCWSETEIIVPENASEEQIEKIEDRLEAFREEKENANPPDFSEQGTKEMVANLVFASHYGSFYEDEEYAELEARPVGEVENAIRGLLDFPQLQLSYMLNCLKVSEIVGSEFKTQVGEFFLFKPGNERLDDSFFFGVAGEGKFFEFLESPEIDQSHIIDRLVSEGRLAKSAPETVRFRTQLAGKFGRGREVNTEPTLPKDIRSPKIEDERSFNWLSLAIGLLTVGIAFLFSKVWKKKLAP